MFLYVSQRVGPKKGCIQHSRSSTLTAVCATVNCLSATQRLQVAIIALSTSKKKKVNKLGK